MKLSDLYQDLLDSSDRQKFLNDHLSDSEVYGHITIPAERSAKSWYVTDVWDGEDNNLIAEIIIDCSYSDGEYQDSDRNSYDYDEFRVSVKVSISEQGISEFSDPVGDLFEALRPKFQRKEVLTLLTDFYSTFKSKKKKASEITFDDLEHTKIHINAGFKSDTLSLVTKALEHDSYGLLKTAHLDGVNTEIPHKVFQFGMTLLGAYSDYSVRVESFRSLSKRSLDDLMQRNNVIWFNTNRADEPFFRSEYFHTNYSYIEYIDSSGSVYWNTADLILEKTKNHTDSLLSILPFGERYRPDMVDEEIPRYMGIFATSNYELSILRYLENKEEEIAVFCVPDTFLYSKSSSAKKTRKAIIESHRLKTIIKAPGNTFPDSIVSTVFLILEKEKNEDSIEFIDFSEADYIPDNEECYEELKARSESENHFFKSASDIQEQDYSLHFGLHRNTSHTGHNLSEILTTAEVHRPDLDATYRKISTNNLKGHITLKSDSFGNAEILSTQDDYFLGHTFFSKPTLLVSAIFNKGLNLSYYEPAGGEVIAIKGKDVMAFKIKDPSLSPHWLLQALRKPDIIKRLNDLVQGTAIRRVSQNNFLEAVQLAIPSVQVQQEELKEAKQEILQKHFDESELRDLSFGDSLRLKKHLLSQYCGGLHNVIDPLLMIAENTPSIQTQERFFPDKDWTLANRLGAIKELSSQLGLLVNNLLVTELIHPAEDYKLTSSLPSLCKSLSKINDLNVTYQTDWDSFNAVDINIFWSSYLEDVNPESPPAISNYEPVVKIASENLREVLQNLVANAKTWDAEEVRVDLKLLNDPTSQFSDRFYVLINISNNGKPLAENFSLDRFFTKGDSLTDSSGLGGHHVKTILDHFGGKLTLNNKPEEEFAVSFNLLFPVTELLPLPNNA